MFNFDSPNALPSETFFFIDLINYPKCASKYYNSMRALASLLSFAILAQCHNNLFSFIEFSILIFEAIVHGSQGIFLSLISCQLLSILCHYGTETWIDLFGRQFFLT